LRTVEISSRTASVARFTTFNYSPEFLLGESVKILQTEVTMVPDQAGIYIMRYEAPKRNFFRFYKVQQEFMKSLVLASPMEEKDLSPLPWLKPVD